MRSRWNKLFTSIVAASALFAIPAAAFAGEQVKKTRITDRKKTTHVVSEPVVAPSLEQELTTPSVGEKNSAQVAALMKREAESLYKLGYKVETMRKGEIVIAVIPTDELFLPNETKLMDSYAERLLEPFKPYFRQNGKFKVVVVCHTDDTGKPTYTKSLSEMRAESVVNWFKSNAGATSNVFAFGKGSESPLKPNSTRENRSLNRRIEIYIVPDQATIELARHKK